jgi:hypothetical protein
MKQLNEIKTGDWFRVAGKAYMKTEMIYRDGKGMCYTAIGLSDAIPAFPAKHWLAPDLAVEPIEKPDWAQGTVSDSLAFDKERERDKALMYYTKRVPSATLSTKEENGKFLLVFSGAPETVSLIRAVACTHKF